MFKVDTLPSTDCVKLLLENPVSYAPINSKPHPPPPGAQMGLCWEVCHEFHAPGVGKRGVFAQAAAQYNGDQSSVLKSTWAEWPH